MTFCLNTVNASCSLGDTKEHGKKIPIKTQFKIVKLRGQKKEKNLKNRGGSHKCNIAAAADSKNIFKKKCINNLRLYGKVSGILRGLYFGEEFTQEKLEKVKSAVIELFSEYIKNCGYNFSGDALKELKERIFKNVALQEMFLDNNSIFGRSRALYPCMPITNDILNIFGEVVENYIQNNNSDFVSGNGCDIIAITGEQHVDAQEPSETKLGEGECMGSDQNSSLDYVQAAFLSIPDIEQGLGLEMGLSAPEKDGFFKNILSGLSEIWSKYLSPRASIINVLGMECSRLMFYYVYRPLVCHAYALLPTFSAFVIAVTMKLLKYDDSKIAEVLDRVFNSTGAIE